MNDILWNNSGIGNEWIIGISLLVAVFLVFIEVRKKRGRLSIRVLSLLLIIATLALMVAQPSIRANKRTFPAILLTSGYHEDILDSIKSIYNDDIRVFSTVPFPEANVVSVTGIGHVAQSYPEIEKLYIIGNGLAEWNKCIKNPFEIIPVLNDPPAGIVNILIPDEINVNEPIEIQGTLNNLTDSAVQLVLKGLDGPVDSVAIDMGVSNFSLTANAKLPGRFVYSLAEKRLADNTTVEYPVPLVVIPEEPLNISIHTNAPTFETKFLKNWLGSLGHRIVVRSKVSKGVYHRETINQEVISSSDISEEGLENIDVLVLDGEVLLELNSAMQEAVKNAVFNKAMGLLVLADQSLINNLSSEKLNFLAVFKLTANPGGEATIEKTINGKNIQGEIKKLPYSVSDTESDFEGLYGTKDAGVGKIGLLLATNTYTLTLEGKTDLYAALWSSYIKALLPENNYETSWKLENPIIFENEMFKFDLLNYQEIPLGYISDRNADQYPVHLIQDTNFTNKWTGGFAPLDSGWHKLKLASGSAGSLRRNVEKWFYVHRDSSWNSYRINHAISRTKQLLYNSDSNSFETSPLKTFHKVDRIYFFAIFLLSCAILWIEQKL